jgi:hypothetical protein
VDRGGTHAAWKDTAINKEQFQMNFDDDSTPPNTPASRHVRGQQTGDQPPKNEEVDELAPFFDKDGMVELCFSPPRRVIGTRYTYDTQARIREEAAIFEDDCESGSDPKKREGHRRRVSRQELEALARAAVNGLLGRE